MLNQVKVLAFIALAILGLLIGWYWQILVFAVVFYIVHEVLWSDHIFYDPKSDYQYQFANAKELSLTLENNQLTYDEDSSDNNLSLDTGLVAIKIKAGWQGRIFDPYIEISDGNTIAKQYFERSVNGLRYLNISDWLKPLLAGQPLTLKFKYCLPKTETKLKLMGFNNPDILKKKIMIIAPHADDAEIAAFGLYSQAEDVCIVTLTAGEIEQQAYQHVYKDAKEASILKGRLRAFDSISVPAWGGVPREKVIKLGYFCLCLKEMYDQQLTPVISKGAGVNCTAIFREFNTFKLPTDGDNKATGKNLLEDLKFLLEKYQPEIIVTPHLELDPHQDHYYASLFIKQAISEINFQKVENILYYANHYVHTDMHPFGPPHSIASLPPNFDKEVNTSGILSIPLSEKNQKDKIFALEMMHDLKVQLSVKKKLRKLLQQLLIRKGWVEYGEDEYFRKNIKKHELLFVSK